MSAPVRGDEVRLDPPGPPPTEAGRFGEFGGQCIKDSQGGGGDSAQLFDAWFSNKGLEPECFDAHSLPDQATFTEERSQFCGLVGITAVDGRNGV